MQSTLTLAVRQQDGATVITCEGEIDLGSTAELMEAISTSITRDLQLLRVDASEVGFLDSSGLRCLLEADRRCADNGVRFEIIPSAHVARLLRLCGLVAAANQALELRRSWSAYDAPGIVT
jgi:anti-anti-sigma factor